MLLPNKSLHRTSKTSKYPRLQGIDTHRSVRSSAKRILDIVGAITGLIVTTIVFFPVAIAISLESPGSIFYSQLRCGYRGKPFRIWKFRSMISNADKLQALIANEAKGCIFKNRNDPRVTRVGRFLRRTSLDELPQFWNVLLGEMSLVGTRPPTLGETTCYSPLHWQRLNVKPGMTGEWQVNGRSQVLDFETVVYLDLKYQRQWSITYDLKLILRTLQVVFARTGAY